MGEAINNNDAEFWIVWAFRIIHTNTPPRKLLPTSPINIFDGFQFQIRNPNKDPIRVQRVPLIKKEYDTNITNIDPVNIPSIPSIKLQKFIIPVNPITINAIKHNLIAMLSKNNNNWK